MEKYSNQPPGKKKYRAAAITVIFGDEEIQMRGKIRGENYQLLRKINFTFFRKFVLQ